jgi:hypothetical protein
MSTRGNSTIIIRNRRIANELKLLDRKKVPYDISQNSVTIPIKNYVLRVTFPEDYPQRPPDVRLAKSNESTRKVRESFWVDDSTPEYTWDVTKSLWHIYNDAKYAVEMKNAKKPSLTYRPLKSQSTRPSRNLKVDRIRNELDMLYREGIHYTVKDKSVLIPVKEYTLKVTFSKNYPRTAPYISLTRSGNGAENLFDNFQWDITKSLLSIYRDAQKRVVQNSKRKTRPSSRSHSSKQKRRSAHSSRSSSGSGNGFFMIPIGRTSESLTGVEIKSLF